MGMFTATGNPRYRFGLKGDFQAVFTKGFANNNTGLNFVICCLNRIGRELPVYFQLFKDEDKFTRIINMSLNTAYFLVPHFRLKAVFFKAFNCLFQGRAYNTVCPLPILFLQFLRCGQKARSHVLTGRLNPKLQFRSCRKYQFLYIIYIDIQPGNTVFLNQFENFIAYIVGRIAQNRSGIYKTRSMFKETGYTQSPYRLSRNFIYISVVIVNKPVNARIRLNIYTSIV